MKIMPQIPVIEKQIRMTAAFPGYNHNEIISDGECYEMKNLSGDAFPTMTTRKARTVKSWSGETLEGIHGRAEDLVLIRDEKVYFGDTDTGLEVSNSPLLLPKQIVSMGAYVVIWPDKVYFNTTDLEDKGSMERRWFAYDHIESQVTPPEDAPTACICTGDGEEYDVANIRRNSKPKKSPEDGELWIDSSDKTDVLRQYSEALRQWQEVPTVYVKISGTDIGTDLEEYDSVTISGLEYTYDGEAPAIDERTEKQLEALNGDFIIYDRDDDYIIIIGMLSKACTLDERKLHVDRKAPDLDYICEAGNRLWGCKYGLESHPEHAMTITDSYNAEISLAKSYSLSKTIYKQPTRPQNPNPSMIWIDTSHYSNGIKDGYNWYTWIQVVNPQPEMQMIPTSPRATISFDIAGEIKDLYWKEINISGIAAVTKSETEQYYSGERLNGKHRVYSFSTTVETGYTHVEMEIDGNCSFTTPLHGNYLNQPIYIDLVDEKYQFLNEVHASALGDFKNWNKYMGLSTDSYTANIGSDGPFTGCIKQGGYPVFFKESCIHRIYGMNPDSFQIQTTECDGIQQGSWRSAVNISETIYYQSRHNVMMYDGNMPRSISDALGQTRYSDARAGAYNSKYYISMRKGDTEKYDLFCYDTKRDIWYKEDNTKATGFGRTSKELYYIDEDNNRLVSVNAIMDGEMEDAENPIEWMAVFGISGIEYAQGARADQRGHMYLSRFDLRLYMEEPTVIDLYIEYDSSGEWEHQGTIRGRNRRTIMLPVIPKRCDHMRVKMTGKGKFRLYSIARMLEVGSDG